MKRNFFVSVFASFVVVVMFFALMPSLVFAEKTLTYNHSTGTWQQAEVTKMVEGNNETLVETFVTKDGKTIELKPIMAGKMSKASPSKAKILDKTPHQRELIFTMPAVIPTPQEPIAASISPASLPWALAPASMTLFHAKEAVMGTLGFTVVPSLASNCSGIWDLSSQHRAVKPPTPLPANNWYDWMALAAAAVLLILLGGLAWYHAHRASALGTVVDQVIHRNVALATSVRMLASRLSDETDYVVSLAELETTGEVTCKRNGKQPLLAGHNATLEDQLQEAHAIISDLQHQLEIPLAALYEASLPQETEVCFNDLRFPLPSERLVNLLAQQADQLREQKAEEAFLTDELIDARSDLASANAHAVAVETKLSAISEAHTVLKAENRELADRLQQANDDLAEFANYRDELAGTRATIDGLRYQLETADVSGDLLREMNATLERQLSSAQGEIAEYAEAFKRAMADQAQVEVALEHFTEDAPTRVTPISAVKADASQQQIDHLTAQLQQAEHELASMRQAQQDKQEERDFLETLLPAVNEVHALKAENQRLTVEITAFETTLASERTEAANTQKRSVQRINELIVEIGQLSNVLGHLRQTLDIAPEQDPTVAVLALIREKVAREEQVQELMSRLDNAESTLSFERCGWEDAQCTLETTLATTRGDLVKREAEVDQLKLDLVVIHDDHATLQEQYGGLEKILTQLRIDLRVAHADDLHLAVTKLLREQHTHGGVRDQLEAQINGLKDQLRARAQEVITFHSQEQSLMEYLRGQAWERNLTLNGARTPQALMDEVIAAYEERMKAMHHTNAWLAKTREQEGLAWNRLNEQIQAKKHKMEEILVQRINGNGDHDGVHQPRSVRRREPPMHHAAIGQHSFIATEEEGDETHLAFNGPNTSWAISSSS